VGWVQAEIAALRRELAEVEVEVKQEQYLRGYAHASNQTDPAGKVGSPVRAGVAGE
jgi:hypothetical protein